MYTFWCRYVLCYHPIRSTPFVLLERHVKRMRKEGRRPEVDRLLASLRSSQRKSICDVVVAVEAAEQVATEAAVEATEAVWTANDSEYAVACRLGVLEVVVAAAAAVALEAAERPHWTPRRPCPTPCRARW